MLKSANSANNGDGLVKFGSFDSADDGEYNGVSFVEKSKMFVMQEDSVNRAFDRVHAADITKTWPCSSSSTGK